MRATAGWGDGKSDRQNWVSPIPGCDINALYPARTCSRSACSCCKRSCTAEVPGVVSCKAGPPMGEGRGSESAQPSRAARSRRAGC